MQIFALAPLISFSERKIWIVEFVIYLFVSYIMSIYVFIELMIMTMDSK